MELVECGHPVQHGGAPGRLAIAVATDKLIYYRSQVLQNGGVIHTDLVKLDTDGKASVQVLIVKDADGYEVCLVGAREFMELCQPTYDTIDFAGRIENGSKEEREVL